MLHVDDAPAAALDRRRRGTPRAGHPPGEGETGTGRDQTGGGVVVGHHQAPRPGPWRLLRPLRHLGLLLPLRRRVDRRRPRGQRPRSPAASAPCKTHERSTRHSSPRQPRTPPRRHRPAHPSVAAGVLGYYTVLVVVWGPVAWTFRVVVAGRVHVRALVVGSFLTAASLAGFAQGFVLFLALPLPLGAPFGGSTAVGAVVAALLWMSLLHLRGCSCCTSWPLAGWVHTRTLEQRQRTPQGTRPDRSTTGSNRDISVN